MEKLNLKDRKILYHLDLDSRQSFRSIGRKVGLSKDVVASRVKKLQEKGVIKNFYTVVDDYRLGYASYRFYLTFQYASPGLKEEIIDYFVKDKQVRFVHSTEGYYNLVLISDLKDVTDIYSVWKKVLSKYRDYFANQVFSVFFQAYFYRHLFLLNENDREQVKRIKYKLYGSGKRVDIDDLDFQLLKLISIDARLPIIEIAKKLNTTIVTIKNRIKKLEKANVIIAFRVGIDLQRLGYKYFKTDLVLKDHKKLSKIMNYIELNPNLSQIILSAGYRDVELVFILQNANQLHEIMQDLSKKFPEDIKDYIYFSILKTHKYDFMPEH